MTVHEVPESRCPRCGNAQDRVEHDFSADPPEPGDIVVCACCAVGLVFKEDLTVRMLTAAEFLALSKEHKVELLTEMAFIVCQSPSRRLH